MALSERDAFKAGFLLRCAEEGFPPAQAIVAADRLVKQSFQAVSDMASAVAKPVASMGVNTLAALALGIPVGVGAAGGYIAHKATEKPIDENDVKQTEMTDEYRRLARVAKLNAKLKGLRSRVGQL